MGLIMAGSFYGITPRRTQPEIRRSRLGSGSNHMPLSPTERAVCNSLQKEISDLVIAQQKELTDLKLIVQQQTEKITSLNKNVDKLKSNIQAASSQMVGRSNAVPKDLLVCGQIVPS